MSVHNRKSYPTAGKAKKMLSEGRARGKKLTGRQKRFMGWVAGGMKKPKGMRSK
jgi:hypothetical protein